MTYTYKSETTSVTDLVTISETRDGSWGYIGSTLNKPDKNNTSNYEDIEYTFTYTPTAEDIKNGVYKCSGASKVKLTSTEMQTGTMKNAGIAFISEAFLRDNGSQLTPTSTVTSSLTKLTTDGSFSLDFQTNSDGAISYVSDNTGVVTVSQTGVVSIVGAGTTSITITTELTALYLQDTKTVSITVSKAAQAVSCTASITKDYNSSNFNLNATVS